MCSLNASFNLHTTKHRHFTYSHNLILLKIRSIANVNSYKIIAAKPKKWREKNMFVSQTTMCLKLNTADSESNNTEQCDNKTNRNVCRAKRFAGK